MRICNLAWLYCNGARLETANIVRHARMASSRQGVRDGPTHSIRVDRGLQVQYNRG